MSARPRPVTSKFRAASAADGSVEPRHYDLSSSGSTDSLVSILDHASLDELRAAESAEEAIVTAHQGSVEKKQQGSGEKIEASATERRRSSERKVSRTRPQKPSNLQQQRSKSVSNINDKTYIRC